MKNTMHHTRISLKEKNRIELIDMLNKTLASTNDLYIQLKQAHWNIKGMDFIAVHKLLDEIAEQVEEEVDVIAERITALGGTALGTIQAITENTELRTYPVDIFLIKEHLEHLTHNFAILDELTHNNIIRSQEVGDYATNDLYIELARMLEKQLWLLEAHLQK